MKAEDQDGGACTRRDFFQSLFKQLASTAGSLVSPAAKGLVVAARAAAPAGPPRAVVDNALCFMGQGRPCDGCVKACPVSPKAVAVSAVGLSAGVNAALCTGCGECAKICPAKAIAIAAGR
ncbi:MAG: 4Fe-4S binding protein [Elusimicrobia bacterium]|nr:4Fe-4S binding protein [Elusimicrobiota bacterium]